tara:strand:- start:923 stop:1558 length:636 start_codon:yes stop_codon:yes gene_type:complete
MADMQRAPLVSTEPSGDASSGPRFSAPVCILTGLVGWIFGMTPFGSALLGYRSNSDLRDIVNHQSTFASFMGICLVLVVVGALMTALVPSIGLRPRTDPDWKQFYRERNRAAGLLLLSGVPLILAGMLALVMLVLTKAGLFGSELTAWSSTDGVSMGAAVGFVLIGLLTMYKAWVLMKLVPWERHAAEPLPADPGPAPSATSTPGASIGSL